MAPDTQTSLPMRQSPSTFFKILTTPYEDLSGRSQQQYALLMAQQREQQAQNEKVKKQETTADKLALFRTLCGDMWIDAECLTILDTIGEGGFGVVLKCNLTLSNQITRVVALKRLKPDTIHSEGELFEFVEEANLMRKLDCRGLVQLIGLGASNVQSLRELKESLYVVFEYMGGGTLKDTIQRQMACKGKLYTSQNALRWAMQIANAMAYLHNCRPTIIHRDLKLENILLSSGEPWEQKAKVTDLGLHRRLRVDDHEGSVYSGNMYQGMVFADSILANESSRYRKSARSRVMFPPSNNGRFSIDEPEVRPQLLDNTSEVQKLLVPDMPFKSDNSADVNLCPSPTNVSSETASIQLDKRLSQVTQNTNFSLDIIYKLEENQQQTCEKGMQKAIVINNATEKVGSYMYMAPEVFNGSLYNEKVDVFAFGVVLYELFCGRLNVMKIAVTHDPDKVQLYASNVADGEREKIPLGWPQELSSLVESCWEQEYEKRPSFEKIVVALDQLYRSGVINQVDATRPASDYNATMDCGCCAIQ